jgi:hypothetical protein
LKGYVANNFTQQQLTAIIRMNERHQVVQQHCMVTRKMAFSAHLANPQ